MPSSPIRTAVLLSLAGVLCFSLAAPAGARIADVLQESSPGAADFTSIGTIEVFETTGTIAAFYDYRGSRYHGPVPAQDDMTQLFLVDSDEDGIALIVLHGPGGGSAMTQVEILDDPHLAGFRVRDDVSDGRDVYTGQPGDALFTADQTWIGNYTDGYAIGELDPETDVLFQFIVELPTNIQGWIATSADAQNIDLGEIVVDQRAMLALPEPGSAGLALGCGLIVALVARRQGHPR